VIISTCGRGQRGLDQSGGNWPVERWVAEEPDCTSAAQSTHRVASSGSVEGNRWAVAAEPDRRPAEGIAAVPAAEELSEPELGLQAEAQPEEDPTR